MESNKILLIRPKPDEKDRFILTTPLSLLAVAAPLFNNEFNVKIIDAIVEGDYFNTALKEAEDALCVGITAITGYQIKDGLRISKAIKTKFPDIKIIWGGWHPTIMPVETIINSYIDIVVHGSGEDTFLELSMALREHKDIKNIKGLYYKQNGKIINTPKRYLREIKKLYDLPYEIIDVERYIRATALGERTLDYRTSYGCPYKCTFCADFLMSDRHWYSLSAEQVVRELVNLYEKYNIDSVLILENEFFINKNRIRQICEGLIKHNVNLKFGNLNVRANQLLDYEPEMLELMKNAGMKDLLIGVESGNQKILDYIDKKTKVGDLVKLKELTSKFDMELFMSFMIGFGHPDVSIGQELEDILNLVEECRKINNKQLIFISIYMPYPGTELFNKCVELGLDAPNTLEDWGNIDLTKTHSPWISKNIEKKVNMLNNYIFQYISDQFEDKWDRLYKGKFKFFLKSYHNILKKVALFRFKYRFFYFPIDYYFLENSKNIKSKIVRFKLVLSDKLVRKNKVKAKINV